VTEFQAKRMIELLEAILAALEEMATHPTQ
jgi:hypothetical protein